MWKTSQHFYHCLDCQNCLVQLIRRPLLLGFACLIYPFTGKQGFSRWFTMLVRPLGCYWGVSGIMNGYVEQFTFALKHLLLNQFSLYLRNSTGRGNLPIGKEEFITMQVEWYSNPVISIGVLVFKIDFFHLSRHSLPLGFVFLTGKQVLS